MKKYDFDQVIDRHGTCCSKFDGIGKPESDYAEVIPMWIADMDFATPSCIADAIRKRLEHPVLGYAIAPDSYYDAIIEWFGRHYGFRPEREELVYTPGVVSGIFKLIQCLTKEGDGVVIMPPVYYPFFNVTNGSRRKLLEAPLRIVNHHFEIDWAKLEEQLQEAKLMIISHPHNPGGRVWSVEELKHFAELADKHDVYIISDEIHADLTFPQYQHHPFPSVSDLAKKRCITLMAPSKAFNMPGVIGSHLYIRNPELREKVFEYLFVNGLGHAACYTFDAITAAYQGCDEWLKACIEYVGQNVDYVEQYLRERIPSIKMIRPEASFLVFLDCAELGFQTPDELNDFFVKKAGLYLDRGIVFGHGGEMYMRLNVGTPRCVLEEAMARLEKAVREKP